MLIGASYGNNVVDSFIIKREQQNRIYFLLSVIAHYFGLTKHSIYRIYFPR